MTYEINHHTRLPKQHDRHTGPLYACLIVRFRKTSWSGLKELLLLYLYLGTYVCYIHTLGYMTYYFSKLTSHLYKCVGECSIDSTACLAMRFRTTYFQQALDEHKSSNTHNFFHIVRSHTAQQCHTWVMVPLKHF